MNTFVASSSLSVAAPHVPPRAAAAVAPNLCTLVPGAALSLRPLAPTALRIAEGRAWVTLDDGPRGARGEASGDVFLCAGETLWVAGGQHAVVESLDGQPLHYRLTHLQGRRGAESGQTTWWQRRTVGSSPLRGAACGA